MNSMKSYFITFAITSDCRSRVTIRVFLIPNSCCLNSNSRCLPWLESSSNQYAMPSEYILYKCFCSWKNIPLPTSAIYWHVLLEKMDGEWQTTTIISKSPPDLYCAIFPRLPYFGTLMSFFKITIVVCFILASVYWFQTICLLGL